MAKEDSRTRGDVFVLALSIQRGGHSADAFVQMRVSDERVLSRAIAQARQFVRRHQCEKDAFPGADIWLNGHHLVFSDGSGEGSEWSVSMVTREGFKRLMPTASGNYRLDEKSGKWYLIRED